MVGISDLASSSPPLTLLGVAACLLTSRSAHSEKVIESLLGPWLGARCSEVFSAQPPAETPRLSPSERNPILNASRDLGVDRNCYAPLCRRFLLSVRCTSPNRFLIERGS